MNFKKEKSINHSITYTDYKQGKKVHLQTMGASAAVTGSSRSIFIHSEQLIASRTVFINNTFYTKPFIHCADNLSITKSSSLWH